MHHSRASHQPSAASLVKATRANAIPLAAAPSPNEAVPGALEVRAKRNQKASTEQPNDGATAAPSVVERRPSKRPARLDESVEAPQHLQRQGRAGSSKQGPVQGGSDVHDAEKIIKERKLGGRVEFCVRWAGYSHAHDSWEPEANVRAPNSPLEAAVFGHLHVPPRY
jgi:hypothetical protein